ncbi:MAG: response regulator [Dehalococcoidales bacterium]|nr:response regulator [Dehalococcoidales bacterium]
MEKRKRRILLVDDHVKLMYFITVALRLQNFEVVTADTGQKGLDEIKSREPDILLLDIQMPQMDGFEVLRQLRKLSKMPVIAFSSYPEYSSHALECGASDFLMKPFDMNHLLELVHKWTDHHK